MFVLYDGFQPLDLAGPWQAFSSANEEAGRPLYALHTIAATPVVATWEQGLRMQVDGTFEADGDAPIDMLLVPGGPGVDRAGSIDRTSPSKVTRPTASRWRIIREASAAASRRACSSFDAVRPAKAMLPEVSSTR